MFTVSMHDAGAKSSRRQAAGNQRPQFPLGLKLRCRVNPETVPANSRRGAFLASKMAYIFATYFYRPFRIEQRLNSSEK